MRIIIPVVLLLFLIMGTSAQSEPTYFTHFTASNGLSNNWVRCIIKDYKGFMWFGTADGLSRFDGYDFKVFRPLDNNGRNLGDIHVNALLQRSKDELWVCTDIGVYSFNLITQTSLEMLALEKSVVLCVREDKDGNVWFGTSKGLYQYQLADSSLRHYTSNDKLSSDLTQNYINTLFEDTEKNLWIGTKNGLKCFDRRSKSIITVKDAVVAKTLTGTDVMAICEDNRQRLWIGTAQDGLYLISGNNQAEKSIVTVKSGSITSLLVDYEHNILVGSGTYAGLLKIDPEGQTKSGWKSDNSVFCIYEDNLKDIWVGTLNGGINFFSKREKKFHTVRADLQSSTGIKSNHVNTFLEDQDNLWIGTEDGLERYNRKSGKYKHFSYQPDNVNTLGANIVFALLKDTRNNLWVGTWSGGLNLYIERTEAFRRFLTGGNSNTLSSNNVISLHEDRKGNFWVGTQGGGVNRYNFETGTFTHYVHENQKPGSLYHESVNKILETTSGKLYLSTYFSLDEYVYQRDSFVHYIYNPGGSSVGSKIISLFEDSRKNIWVATNQGLVHFNEAEKEFEPYFSDSSFLDNVIQGILEDSRGHLWISTNNGLYKIIDGSKMPIRPEFVRFSDADGLSDNEFIKRAAYKGKNGMLYFGSSKGFTFFHPDSILLNTHKPEVVLTEFKLLHTQPDQKGKYQSMPGNINTDDQIDLDYRNTDFVLRFAALNYLHTEKNHYQYKLEGYDKQWIDAGSDRTATYTNIHPGKYTFIVKGSNNDGIWNDKPNILRIVIHPPWWRTLFFQIVLIVAAVLLVFSVYLIRIRFLKRQNRYLEQKVRARTTLISEMNTTLEEKQEEIIAQNNELEKHRNHLEMLVAERTSELVKAKIKAEESDQLKSSFLANMSHEIRTPMNAIYGFASLLKDAGLNENEESEYLDIISSNCESLLVLFDDLLDISMIESNQIKINKTQFEVDGILTEIEKQLNIKHSNNLEIAFVNKGTSFPLQLYNDKTRFIQVFTNLLNNALKFTEQGHIYFGYQLKRDEVIFYVADTGRGIDHVHIGKVFDQFYKIENDVQKHYPGIGIGLTICSKLVALMGGKISVESAVNKGSTFFFTLPTTKESTPMVNEEFSAHRKMLWLKDITILIAEDNPTNYRLLSAMLKNSGARIYWAQDGQEAISFVKNKPADEKCIVLMDIKMPVIDGFEANRQIKLIDKEIPVIAVTAYAQLSDKEKIMNSQFDGYIAKPFNLETLIKTLAVYETP